MVRLGRKVKRIISESILNAELSCRGGIKSNMADAEIVSMGVIYMLKTWSG